MGVEFKGGSVTKPSAEPQKIDDPNAFMVEVGGMPTRVHVPARTGLITEPEGS